MNPAISPVRIAVVQFDPQVGTQHGQTNLQTSLQLALQAAKNGANLIVLPELANTGYLFANRQDAFKHAEGVPDGPSVCAWLDFAQQHQVYLVAGLAEQDGMQLFDTAVLLGPHGFIGKYRKAHLWNKEKLWFTPRRSRFSSVRNPHRAHRPDDLLGCLVSRSTAPAEPARRRHYLQPQQLGLDTPAAVR